MKDNETKILNFNSADPEALQQSVIEYFGPEQPVMLRNHQSH